MRSPGLDSSDNLAGLVGLFYDAALDDTLWAGLAGRIAHALNAPSAVLKLHDANDHVALVEVTDNMIVGDRLRDWADHWHAHDLWVQRSVTHGLSHIVTDSDLVCDDERRKTGFYQEWLAHLDIHYMIGAAFAVGDSIGVLGIHRPAGATSFGDDERRKVSVLLPHLQRAMHLGRRIADITDAERASLQGLDTIDTGVMIIDAGCQVLHANRTAEAMLARSAELVFRQGRLAARDSSLHVRLRAAVGAALSTAAGHLPAGEGLIRIDRPDHAPWSLSISPVRPRWRQIPWQRPLALILMRDPEFPPYRIEALRALFGLTRMEAVVGVRLISGETPLAIAEGLAIGIGTVRTHLKQILLKTGTSRQAEAVAVMGRSVAADPLF